MNESNNQEPLALHPTIFVIMGITGDLSLRKLLPALLALFSKRLLPPRFMIVGFSRRSFSREEFRTLIREGIHVRPGEFREEDIKHFLDHITYEQGYFDAKPAYIRLAERLKSIDDRWGQCSNKLFHLSVPPSLYENIVTNLADSGLTVPCDDHSGWTRVLIEKPFGDDIKTARSLDKLLAKLFAEEQIFRIDHYLAKEALQNIIAFRFGNPMFEPMWNKTSIDKIHIKLFEKVDVEGRGALFDKLGTLKDVGQNHVLQMLALVAMNEPRSFRASDIRRERAAILRALPKMSKTLLSKNVIRGQYKGYLSEPGVIANSKTETYFRLKTFLNSARWRGVPFYLESGKALAEARTEIDIYFKDKPRRFIPGFSRATDGLAGQNILTFRIQPDQCIKIKFFVKNPGYGFETSAKTLRFKYSEVPSFSVIPNDYERLIHDAFIGDQTLFASTEEIMASWEFVTPIVEAWKDLPLQIYEKGTGEVE